MIVQQFDLTHSSLFVVVVAFNTEFNVGFHAISIKADDCGTTAMVRLCSE